MGFCLDTLPQACDGRQKIASPFDRANWFNSQIHSQRQPTQTVRSRIASLLKLSQAQETLQGISRNAARDIEATPRPVVDLLWPWTPSLPQAEASREVSDVAKLFHTRVIPTGHRRGLYSY